MLTFKMKSMFFDRQVVMNAIGKASAKALQKVGGTIRKTAQRSMRYRKHGKASPKGTPPFAHKDGPRGPLLRDKLWFAYEPARKSVVIGPVGFGPQAGGNTVPHAHEFGGSLTRLVRLNKPKHGRRATPAQAAAFKRKLQSGQIRPKVQPKVAKAILLAKRPFMGPALKKQIAASSAMSVWKDSVRAA